MSDTFDPTGAVVSITWKTISGTTITTEQGSGVLIAPDEVLTAAHLVYDAAGHTVADIVVGAGIASGAPRVTATEAGVHAMALADWTQLASASGDLALVHLATPLSGVPVMALGPDFAGGAVTVTGYPVSAGGSEASLDETLTTVPGLAGVLQGAPLGLPGDPHGASGGPAWHMVDGIPTVVGLTSSASGSTGYFVGLTAADVSEIDAWMKADHTSAVAAAPVAMPTAAVTPAPDAAAALVTVAEALPAVASHPAIDAALSRVAALLARDAAILGAEATFDDVATLALSGLGRNGSHRNLAAALLQGVVWGHDGGSVGEAVAAVAGSDPGILGYSAAKQAVHAGAQAGRMLLAEGH